MLKRHGPLLVCERDQYAAFWQEFLCSNGCTHCCILVPVECTYYDFLVALYTGGWIHIERLRLSRRDPSCIPVTCISACFLGYKNHAHSLFRYWILCHMLPCVHALSSYISIRLLFLHLRHGLEAKFDITRHPFGLPFWCTLAVCLPFQQPWIDLIHLDCWDQ